MILKAVAWISVKYLKRLRHNAWPVGVSSNVLRSFDSLTVVVRFM